MVDIVENFCKSRDKMINSISKKIRKGKHSKCITKKMRLTRILKIDGRIGSGSINGEALKAKIRLKNKKSFVAIKRIPMKKIDISFISNPVSKKALNSSTVWSEILMLRLCDFLLKKGVCYNLPWFYKYYTCNNCDYINKELQNSSKNCIMLINELNDGDLKKYVLELNPSLTNLVCCYLQIFMGLYSLKKYFGITHHDLHWGNVLYKKIHKGNIKYIIDKKEIVLPNVEYLFILWDFGYARIPGKVEPINLKSIYDQETSPLEDFSRISTMLLKDEEQTNEDYDRLSRYFIGIVKKYNNENVSSNGLKEMKCIINNIYKDFESIFLHKKTTTENTCVFNMDTKLTTKNRTIKKYLR